MKSCEETRTMYPYGYSIIQSENQYELHWYTTAKDEDTVEICEKCGKKYKKENGYICCENKPYHIVNSSSDAQKILNQEPNYEEKITGHPFGYSIKLSEGMYELHWYPTVTGENNEVCEKCGRRFAIRRTCNCSEHSHFKIVPSLKDVLKHLEQIPL